MLYEAIRRLSRGTFTALTVVNGAISFYLLALIDIPVGTDYAVDRHRRAAGSVLAGMFFFKESRDRKLAG